MLLPGRKRAHRHGNDNRVVAGKRQVQNNDLEQIYDGVPIQLKQTSGQI
jgi:hypothetical protein